MEWLGSVSQCSWPNQYNLRRKSEYTLSNSSSPTKTTCKYLAGAKKRAAEATSMRTRFSES